jgi:hypothetical protein
MVLKSRKNGVKDKINKKNNLRKEDKKNWLRKTF